MIGDNKYQGLIGMIEKIKLTDSSIKKMQSSTLRDTEITGFVVIARKGGRFFYLEYRSPMTKKAKKYAIGRWGNLTASEARDLAKIAAGQVAKGECPQTLSRERKNETTKQELCTLRDYLDNGYKEITSEKTAASATKRIEKHFSKLLNKPISQISSIEIMKWQKQYKGAPSGANRILTDLQGVLTKAVKSGLIDKSPMTGVKKLREDKNQKIRYLTHAEEARLMHAIDTREGKRREERLRYIKHCESRSSRKTLPPHGTFTDHVKPLVITALNTGLRRGELFSLRLSAIDFDARLLTVDGGGTKSGQTRQIPLNDDVFSTLKTWIQETKNKGYVFPSPESGGRLDNIDSAWEAIREAAGLPEAGLHTLRHTFGTRLAHKRVDLVTIKDLMGHSSLDVTARYLHTNNILKIKAVMELCDASG